MADAFGELCSAEPQWTADNIISLQHALDEDDDAVQTNQHSSRQLPQDAQQLQVISRQEILRRVGRQMHLHFLVTQGLPCHHQNI